MTVSEWHQFAISVGGGFSKETMAFALFDARSFNNCIIGVTEGEEKEKEIGNLLEKTMKEKFRNLVKEIDMQVQEAQSPKQDACKEAHTKTHYN